MACLDWRGSTECVNDRCLCTKNHYTKDKVVCIPCPTDPVSTTAARPFIQFGTVDVSLLGKKINNIHDLYSYNKMN